MIRDVFLRCPQCRSTTRVKAEWAGDEPVEIACSSCNAVLTLEGGRDRGYSNQDYHDRIARYASTEHIDLASAGSVYEGILSREMVRTLPYNGVRAAPEKATTSLGSLAVLSAMLIAGPLLASRLVAVWNPHAQRSSPAAATRGAVRPAEKRDAAPAVGPVLYEVDAQNALTRVSGSDPRSVLSGLCAHDQNRGPLVPQAVAQGVPPSPRLRIGVIRDRWHRDRLVTVRIWLDPRSRQWTIGGGEGPIELGPMGEFPLDVEVMF